MKSIFRLCVCAAVAAAFGCAVPAHAGSWQLTSSYSGTDSPGSWGYNGVNSSSSTSYNFEAIFDNTSAETGSWTYTGTIQWVGGGTQPSSVTLTETAEAQASSGYSSTATQSADDGFGDPTTVTTTNNPYPGKTTTSSGTHTTVVNIPAGQTYTFTRTLSASSVGATLDDGYVNYSISIQ